MSSFKGIAVLLMAMMAALSCSRDQPTGPTPSPQSPILVLAVVVDPKALSAEDIDLAIGLLSDGKFSVDNLKAVWREFYRIDLWASIQSHLQAITEDPRVAVEMYGILLARRENGWYVLIHGDHQFAISPFELTNVTFQNDATSLGYPAIGMLMSGVTDERYKAFVSANRGAYLAAIVDGNVISTANEEPWIRFNNFRTGENEREILMSRLRRNHK